VVEALTDFGRHYGMAFQVVDDLLDVVATDEQLGKPAGNDLVEGTYTLPVIRALAGPSGSELRDLLGGPIDAATRDRVRDVIRTDEAIGATRDTAIEFLGSAREALDGLPANPSVGTMQATCDLLLDRLDGSF
jgi:geranylgeranyl pyrophosphate synthase